MPKKRTAAPATKADIRLLMKAIGKIEEQNRQQSVLVDDANRRLKQEILEQLDIRFELLRNDVLSANSDRFGNHELRISRLEQSANLDMG